MQLHISKGIVKDHIYEDLNPKVKSLRGKTHRTILKVKDDYIRRHSFNTAIAAIMELTNTIPKEFLSKEATDEERASADEAIRSILIMLSPIVPHITHILWRNLGNTQAIIDEPWPDVMEDLLIEEIIELAVQVNGKLRTTLKVDRNLAKKDIEELVRNDTKMINHLKNKKVKKIIHVEGRLVNFVL